MTAELPSREQLVGYITRNLEDHQAELTQRFQTSVKEVGVRYSWLDGLLPDEVARAIHNHFPPVEEMRLMSSFRERKFTSKNFDAFHPLMADITFAIQDPRVIAIVGRITGIADQIPDPSLYAGGLSAMTRGHFLGPHLDNSHEASRQYYRTLNLLYYVSPDWSLASGGNLELWDRDVRHNATIVSAFNRLVIMETNPWSWHSVNKVQVDGVRCCVSNYYFSPSSPIGRDYFNVTSFSARPDQPVRRLVSRIDNQLREWVRVIRPQGVGRKDVYQGQRR